MIITINTDLTELGEVYDAIAKRTAALLQPQLAGIITLGNKLMATMADIQAAVAAETTVDQSAIVLLQQISASLQAAIAANDPVAMQAVVDGINANAASLAAAVSANTPVVPPAP